MAGTAWNSASLLDRFNRMAGRPTGSGAVDAIPAVQKFQRLADAQEDVILALAAVAPRGLYGAPTAMTSTDGGYTWGFGTDTNGDAIYPLGNASIYPNLDAVPDYPWQPNADYLDEGTRIRIPNNIAWSGPLYWYGISAPPRITATVEPTIAPLPARILIVIKAVQSFAEEGNRNAPLVDAMTARWDREWPTMCTAMRKHLRGGRALGPLASAGALGGAVWGSAWGGGSYGW